MSSCRWWFLAILWQMLQHQQLWEAVAAQICRSSSFYRGRTLNNIQRLQLVRDLPLSGRLVSKGRSCRCSDRRGDEILFLLRGWDGAGGWREEGGWQYCLRDEEEDKKPAGPGWGRQDSTTQMETVRWCCASGRPSCRTDWQPVRSPLCLVLTCESPGCWGGRGMSALTQCSVSHLVGNHT